MKEIKNILCVLCQKYYNEKEVRPGRAGMICENCDEEPQNGTYKQNHRPIIKENISTNTFYRQTEESQGKATQILNIEELNQQIEIPTELSVGDCPTKINSD